MSTEAKDCQHEQFLVTGNVGRLTKEEGGPVTNYTLDVTVECGQCKRPFAFIGPAAGFSFSEVMVSVQRTELRCPIEPAKSLHEYLGGTVQ